MKLIIRSFKNSLIWQILLLQVLSIALSLLSITENPLQFATSVEAKSSLSSYHSFRTQSPMVAFVTKSSSSSNLLIPSQAINSSSKQQSTTNNKRNSNHGVVLASQRKSNQRMSKFEDGAVGNHESSFLSLIPSQRVNSRINPTYRLSSTSLFAKKKSFCNRDNNNSYPHSSTSLSFSQSSSEDDNDSNLYETRGRERDSGGSTSTINQIEDDEAGDTILLGDNSNNDVDMKNSDASNNRNRKIESSSNNKGNQQKKLNGINNDYKDRSPNQYRSKWKSSKTKFQNKSKSSNNNDNQQQQQRRDGYPQSFRYTGNLPDIHWRAIPMKHLRAHPNYQPLPKPKYITHISHLEDVRQFRQDSWQWDMLHSGRCTTSQAAPALGLLETHAAKMLGIPKSLQKGCMGAYVRLGQSALRTLEEMNSVLCCHDEEQYYDDEDEWFYQTFQNNNYNKNIYDGSNGDSDTNSTYVVRRRIWKKMPKRRYPFAARYSPPITMEEICDRRQQTKKYMSTLSSPMRIRMNWGNSQEATAILTALNYFYSVDPDVIVKEVGMCGAGLKYNTTSLGNYNDNHDLHDLILGASPDAVIQYSNGTLEALEVKNHCPFVPTRRQLRDDNSNSTTSNKSNNSTIGRGRGSYRIREMPIQATVPPAYIPQLMMEMLCLGDECKSAVMCRQTATNGAVLVRLRRDEEWINEMIYWLERFVNDYVKKGTPPPRNFFWFDGESDGSLCDRYQRFVRRTKELSDGVELVKYIEHGSIQRVLGDQGVRLPLFLD